MPNIHLLMRLLVVCVALGPLPGGAQEMPAEMPVLAQQWHALRMQSGHFDGAAWNAAVDRWQGPKHQVMQQLAQQARQGQWTAAVLTKWMGAADQVLRPTDADYARVWTQAQWQGTSAGPLWLYRWRGTHDQLVLALPADRVAAVGWLYALE